MAVAIMSYNGKLHFGLLGDYDAMSDLEVFGTMLEESLAELAAAAKEASPERSRRAAGGDGKPQRQRKAPRKTAAKAPDA
jgi:hypothetical protein